MTKNFQFHCSLSLCSHNKFVTWDVLEKTAAPADLIEFCRGEYNHWAMMSEYPGKVYNICAEDKGETSAEIKLERLSIVCERGPTPKRCRARVNNEDGFRGLLAMAFTGPLEPLSPEESIELAGKMEGTFVPYEFTGRNCEYYCTLWKFGKGFTDQVTDFSKFQIQISFQAGRYKIINFFCMLTDTNRSF